MKLSITRFEEYWDKVARCKLYALYVAVIACYIDGMSQVPYAYLVMYQFHRHFLITQWSRVIVGVESLLQHAEVY